MTERGFGAYSKLLVSAALQKSVGARTFIHPFHIMSMLSTTGVLKFQESEWTKSVLMFESCLPKSFNMMKSAMEANDILSMLEWWKLVRKESSFIFDAYQQAGKWEFSTLDPRTITEARLLEYYSAEIQDSTAWVFGIDAQTVLRWLNKAIKDYNIDRKTQDVLVHAPNIIIPNDEDEKADIEDFSDLKEVSAPVSSISPDWAKYTEKNKAWSAVFGKYSAILTRWLPMDCYLGSKNADLEIMTKETPISYLLEKSKYTKLDVSFLFEKGAMANSTLDWVREMTAQCLNAFLVGARRAYFSATLHPITAETVAERNNLAKYYNYMADRLMEVTRIDVISNDIDDVNVDSFLKLVAEKGDPFADLKLDELEIKRFLERGGPFDSLLKIASEYIKGNKEQLLDTAIGAASTVLPYGQLLSTGYKAAKKFGLFDSVLKKKDEPKVTEQPVIQNLHPNALLDTKVLQKTVEPKSEPGFDNLAQIFASLFS
jgi:hypothetical protein